MKGLGVFRFYREDFKGEVMFIGAHWRAESRFGSWSGEFGGVRTTSQATLTELWRVGSRNQLSFQIGDSEEFQRNLEQKQKVSLWKSDPRCSLLHGCTANCTPWGHLEEKTRINTAYPRSHQYLPSTGNLLAAQMMFNLFQFKQLYLSSKKGQFSMQLSLVNIAINQEK